MTKTRAEQTAERREQFAQRFYQHLHANYNRRGFTLKQLAVQMGIRYNWLSERIVTCTGKTFLQHRREIRTSKLRNLIESGHNVRAAEAECGIGPRLACLYIDHPARLSKQSRQRLRDQRLHNQLFGQ